MNVKIHSCFAVPQTQAHTASLWWLKILFYWIGSIIGIQVDIKVFNIGFVFLSNSPLFIILIFYIQKKPWVMSCQSNPSWSSLFLFFFITFIGVQQSSQPNFTAESFYFIENFKKQLICFSINWLIEFCWNFYYPVQRAFVEQVPIICNCFFKAMF